MCHWVTAPFNATIGTLAGLAVGLLRDAHKLPLTDALVLIRWCTCVLALLQQQQQQQEPEDGVVNAAMFCIAWSGRRDETLAASNVSATSAASGAQLPVPREVVVLPASAAEQIDTSYSTPHQLLVLPTDILAHVLFPFLAVTDISRLDVAVTTRILRPQLFEVYPYLSLEPSEKGITSGEVQWFFKRLIALRRISFSSRAISYGDMSAVFEELKKNMENAKLVRHVQCSCVADISHHMQALKYFTGLESLELSGCRHATGAALFELSQSCGSLTELRLSDCDVTTDALICFTRNWPSLTTLSLCRCRGIGDAGACDCSSEQVTLFFTTFNVAGPLQIIMVLMH